MKQIVWHKPIKLMKEQLILLSILKIKILKDILWTEENSGSLTHKSILEIQK